MHRFRHVESAAAQQSHAHGLEVIRADAVQVRFESKTFCRGRGLRVRRRIRPAALHRFVELDHSERHRGGNARAFDTGQGREPFLQRAIQILRARLVVGRETRVGFQKIIRARLQTGIDVRRLARAANEERGRREQRERECDLHHDERIARQKLPAPDDCIFARLFLQVADDCGLRQLQRRPEREGKRSEKTKCKSRREHRHAQAALPDDIDRQFFA